MNNGKVYVVDDDPAVRDSLAMLIEQDGISTETFASAHEFLSASGSLDQIACAIIDVRMPGMDGLELQAELAQRKVLVPIIFLTGHGTIPMSVRAIKAGAVNFLTKPITGTELRESVQAALAECEKLLNQSESINTATKRLSSLTHREHEVMALAVAGLSNKEIARHLGISHRTVEIHKARVMHKTGAETLLDLVHLAETGKLLSNGTAPGTSIADQNEPEMGPL